MFHVGGSSCKSTLFIFIHIKAKIKFIIINNARLIQSVTDPQPEYLPLLKNIFRKDEASLGCFSYKLFIHFYKQGSLTIRGTGLKNIFLRKVITLETEEPPQQPFTEPQRNPVTKRVFLHCDMRKGHKWILWIVRLSSSILFLFFVKNILTNQPKNHRGTLFLKVFERFIVLLCDMRKGTISKIYLLVVLSKELHFSEKL